MIVTPGDILGRCQMLDARIAAADKAIRVASPTEIDTAFRQAWDARVRRWRELREQCGEWASRWWNYKWGPILDDWYANQATWEADIERRTARRIPVPVQIKPDESPRLPALPDGKSVGLTLGLGIAAVAGVAAVGWAVSRARN